MAERNTAMLVHEWDYGKDRYRLISKGKWSAGYKDLLVLEKMGQDGLGEPSWQSVYTWKPGELGPHMSLVTDLLVVAIESLRKE